MIKIKNYDQLNELVMSFLEAHPDQFLKYEEMRFDICDTYKARLNNAKMATQGGAVYECLEGIEAKFDSCAGEYEKALNRYFKSNIRSKLLLYGVTNGLVECDDDLFETIMSEHTVNEENYFKKAGRLLAQHTIAQTAISGERPTKSEITELLESYGLYQEENGYESFMQVRNELGAEQSVYLRNDLLDRACGMTAKSASLVFDNQLLSANGLDFGNYKEKLASGKCDAWADKAFSNMVNGIYTDRELKELKRRDIDPLDGIFLNGKPINEAIKSSSLYDPNVSAEKQRMRCAADLILGGECKVNLARYELTEYSAQLSDEVAEVKVEPKIKEKFSLIRAIKRFFGYDRSTEENKQRITMANLENEEVSKSIADELREQKWSVKNIKRDYMTKLRGLRVTALESNLQEGQTFGALGSYIDPDSGKKVTLVNTIAREPSISSLAAAYMISRGLTTDAVLSSVPSLDGVKKQMGKELLDALTILDKDQYISTKFPDAQMSEEEKKAEYKKYINTRTNEIADLYNTSLIPALEKVGRQIEPFDVERRTSLTDNYDKIKLLSGMAVDIYQSSTELVKKCTDAPTKDKLIKGTDTAFYTQFVKFVAEHAENVERLCGAERIDESDRITAEKEFGGVVATRVVASKVMDCIRQNGEGFVFTQSNEQTAKLQSLGPGAAHIRNLFADAVLSCPPQDRARLFAGCAMVGIGRAPIPAELEGNLNNRINQNSLHMNEKPLMPAFEGDCSVKAITDRMIESSSKASHEVRERVQQRINTPDRTK